MARALEILIRLAIGGVFLYAGAVKAWDPILFHEQVRAYQLLDDPYSAFVAIGLPWLEIFCGLSLLAAAIYGIVARGANPPPAAVRALLVSRHLHLGATLLIAGQLIAFIGGILSARARNLDIACGCFGSQSSSVNDWTTLAFDAVLLLGCGFLLWRGWRRSPARSSS
ncbi:MAG: hypothetical protein R3F11_24685 [Verrucomicrobiales bacterium]